MNGRAMRRLQGQLQLRFRFAEPLHRRLSRDALVRSLRGKIIASMGGQLGEKFRMRCPDCNHRGVGAVNHRTGLVCWSCGKCDLHEPGFILGDKPRRSRKKVAV